MRPYPSHTHTHTHTHTSLSGVAQGIGLEFKPQYHKKKNRERHSDVNIDAVLKVFHLITTFLVLLG
jgi:hypothetical protein